MPASAENSPLKRAASTEDQAIIKKARRSQRLSEQIDPQTGLPSPLTGNHSATTENSPHRRTASPPPAGKRHNGNTDGTDDQDPPQLRSPPSPSDTQLQSEFLPPVSYSYEVENEEEEGVWGYLIPVDGTPQQQQPLVLKKRSACPMPVKEIGDHDGQHRVGEKELLNEEKKFEQKKKTTVPAGGYLIGRHPECDRIVNTPTVSNRHCLFFTENKLGSSIAVMEDLSGNGTYVNDAYVGRNKRRELNDGDEISILDAARYIFRYPRVHDANGFRQQYAIDTVLGKGHFATVYLCTERNSGMRFAVKHFARRTRGSSSVAEEKSKVDGLQQEVAVLMGVSHPNVLCLKDTFNERDGVYLILELAAEGELFNCIVTKQKLTEVETRRIFMQLFKGVRYLHERNIVHRDIKPENILLIDKDLNIKIADFGLAKIIGEESFTSTLCGTPSYVAPEILESGKHRRYTKAVDVWSLGVVLYICLCGFPPFSDELYTKENPFTLSQQIRAGRFDYPSPYWDSVGDAALDLIDRMLTVDVERRITIDECLTHPWTTGQVGTEPGTNGIVDPQPPSQDSTQAAVKSSDSLTGALRNLDFSSRKVRRERTLLSEINEVHLTRVVNASQNDDQTKVKVFSKNAAAVGHGNGNGKKKDAEKGMKEIKPSHNRDMREFLQMGGRPDQPLFASGDDKDGTSVYQDASFDVKG